MPFSEEELIQDLATADAAGDTKLATHIAGLIKTKRSVAASVAKQDAALRKGGGVSGHDLENVAAGAGGAVTDMALGGKQAINALTGGKVFDRDTLNAEAAAKKALDAPLMDTTAGKIGNFATQGVTAAMPFGAATRVASLLPRTNMALRATSAILPGASIGAGQEILTPDEDYTLGGQAAKGAALGVGGDLIGRGVGKVLRPMRATLDDAIGQYVRELREGLPNSRLLAENLSGNDAIKALTNALAQIPIAGAGVKGNRRHNLEEVTELATRAAGGETRALTSTSSDALHGAVERQANAFRQGPPLSVPGMPAALGQASNDAQMGARLFGTNQPMRQIRSAYSAIVPPVPRGVPAPPLVVRRIPADTAMDVRRELGDQVFQQQHGLASRGAEAVKDEIEDAFRRRHGNDFDRWLAEHGGSLDVRRLQGTKNAVTPTGQIRPEEFRRLNMSDTEVAHPSNPFYRTMRAASERMASPSLAENRSLMVRLLMGGALPGAGAGIGAAFGDEGGAAKGALAGTGTLALAAWLLGSQGGGRYLTGQNRSHVGRALQSDRMQELLRLAGITALD